MPLLRDDLVRRSAFAWLDQLITGRGVLAWPEIEAGFPVPGTSKRVHFATRAKGIFKPKEITGILSLRTVMPRHGRKIWYADQNSVHAVIFAEQVSVPYSFQGDDPDAPDNRLLQQACERALPLIYFVAVSPAVYRPFYPVFIADVDRSALTAQLVFGLRHSEHQSTIPGNEIEKKYALRLAKQRLHQAMFREAVLDAYQGCCAITGLPERRLLDASHIIPDADQDWGLPNVTNGLPLSKIHHAAYDANLIGIDADGKVHVSPRLLATRDGPFFEQGIRLIDSVKIRMPLDERNRPDPESLNNRFKMFKAFL